MKQSSKNKSVNEDALSALEIGFKNHIIPKFLEDIDESTIDLQLILYLAAAYSRIDIVAAFANGLFKELNFQIEKENVCTIASEYKHKQIVELCNKSDLVKSNK